MKRTLVLTLLLWIACGLHAQVSEVCLDSVLAFSRQFLGTPYRWGGKTPKGFDCAGFTRYVFGHFGLELASAAGPQYRQGTRVDADSIKVGDLVFFAGRNGGTAIGHVGLVTEVEGNTFRFIHASTTAGVIISRSREPYYSSRFIGACRPLQYSNTDSPKTESIVPSPLKTDAP